jgi:hypothetical protein
MNMAKPRVLSNEQQKANIRLSKVRYRYGRVAASLWQLLFDAQGGLCAICGRQGGKKSLNLDHHHDTMQVRGLLCGSCNRALGLLGDDIERMRSAIRYLQRNK